MYCVLLVSSLFAFYRFWFTLLITTVAERANLNDPVNLEPESEKEQRHSNDRQHKFCMVAELEDIGWYGMSLV